MESGRRAGGQKRLCPNQRVSGSVGEFIEGPSKRRRRQRLFGRVIRAVGEKKYLVRFDNGEEKECPSNILKVESIVTSLPPDEQIPIAQNVREEAIIAAEIGEAEQDVDEAEDLPATRPEEKELEEEDSEPEGAVPDESMPAEQQTGEADAGNTEQSNDNEGRIPGQLPTAEQSTVKDYHSIKKAAKEKIAGLVGHEVTVGNQSSGNMTWRVIPSYEPSDNSLLRDVKSKEDFGIRDFSSNNYKRSEVIADIFLKLMFVDWKSKVEKLNQAVENERCKCKKFTAEEFLTGLALIIGSSEFSQKGVDLFGSSREEDDVDDDYWHSISTNPHFEQYMPFSRFKDFRRFLPFIFVNEDKKDTDPWYQFSDAIDEFNEIRSSRLACSQWIVADETMCAWRPRTTALGGLPNISFIIQKPEPLGKKLFLK
jgi:hypothetical protein